MIMLLLISSSLWPHAVSSAPLNIVYFNFIVGGEVIVARHDFFSVVLTNVSLCLDTFYGDIIIHWFIIVNYIKSHKAFC